MNSDKLMETLSKAKAVMNITENKNFKPSSTTLEDLKSKISTNTQENFVKTAKKNGLPTEIYESIISNPLIPNSSIFENFDMSKVVKASQIQTENSKPINQTELTEEKLESLIEKVLEKVLNKKTLNENKEKVNNLNTIRITENKLQFLTSNGDLYVADLKFVKNINK